MSLCIVFHPLPSALRKKFYKEVSITSDNGNHFEINLDGRKVKTPNGSVLKVMTKTLALAVANEWRCQDQVIRSSEMHLTTLANTAIDNPMRVTKESQVSSIIEFLSTDTLCFRVRDPEELEKIQEEKWDPIVEWFMNEFDVDISVTPDIFATPVPEDAKEAITKHLSSYDLPSLIALNFVVENLKSTILSLALLKRRLSVEEAISLSRLETEFQTAKWGNIEWAHDIDLTQTRARVAAGILFVHLSNDFTSTKTRKVSQ